MTQFSDVYRMIASKVSLFFLFPSSSSLMTSNRTKQRFHHEKIVKEIVLMRFNVEILTQSAAPVTTAQCPTELQQQQRRPKNSRRNAKIYFYSLNLFSRALGFQSLLTDVGEVGDERRKKGGKLLHVCSSVISRGPRLEEFRNSSN